MSDILKGIRVLDFTRIVAGPFATRMLADFGAEVIKIQTSRMAVGFESNTAPYFCNWNRNKRSITLDMNHPEARTLFLKLAAISDVVVENFSPRVMANWDLAYQYLEKVNGELIMLSMSGMGQTGPWRDHAAFGPTVQALGGLTHLTAYGPQDPMGTGFAYADMVSGLYGAIAVLTALERREESGRGQLIDLSEYEAACTTLGPALMDACVNTGGAGPDAIPDVDCQAGPYSCYPCLGTDRWCVIAVQTDDEWRALCREVGESALTADDRFSTLNRRQKFKGDLDLIISGWTKERSVESIVERLQKAGVAAGVVQNAQDLANDPQLAANTFFTTLDHPELGEMTADTSPVRFREIQRGTWKASPLLGEANDYVFGELLGLSASEIESFKKRGIIA